VHFLPLYRNFEVGQLNSARKINGINDLDVILNTIRKENAFKNKDLRRALKVVR